MNIDPTTYASTIIGTIAATLITQYLVAKFSHRNRVLGLEHENRRLESELSKQKAALEKEIQAFKNNHAAEITALRDQLRPYIDREAICSTWQFDEPSHTYLEPSTGHRYCTPCLEKMPPEKHILEPTDTGFMCRSCGQRFRDPSKPSRNRYTDRRGLNEF